MRNLRSVVAAGLVVVLAAVTPVVAQRTTLPESVTKPSTHRPTITRQLELAIAEERRALAGFETAASEEDIAVAHQAATNAYVLIRAAREGIFRIKGINSVKKLPEDPMLEITFKKVTTAWNRSRGPVDGFHSAGRRDQYMEVARRQIAETIGMLEELLVIWM